MFIPYKVINLLFPTLYGIITFRQVFVSKVYCLPVCTRQERNLLLTRVFYASKVKTKPRLTAPLFATNLQTFINFFLYFHFRVLRKNSNAQKVSFLSLEHDYHVSRLYLKTVEEDNRVGRGNSEQGHF